jgi:hypothetical protein
MKKYLAVFMGAALMTGAIFAQPVQAGDADLTAKLKDAVGKLSTEQQAALYLLLSQLAGDGGGAPAAAAAPAAVSPEEAAKAAIKTFVEAAGKGEYDKMLSIFSDKFEHYEYGDKAGLKDFLTQAGDMGYLEGLELKLDGAEYKLEGDKLTVYPVELSGSFGSLTFEYVFAKEGDTWKVISFDASGL